MPFLIIFVIVPLMEVYAFINVGEQIGVLRTLLLCVLTAMIGGFLVRQQGLETLFKARQSLQNAQIPLDALFDGFCLVVAGALLLTPGFVTDIVGFALLVPAIRKAIKMIMARYGGFQTHSFRTRRPDDGVIEGEYETVIKEKETLDKPD